MHPRGRVKYREMLPLLVNEISITCDGSEGPALFFEHEWRGGVIVTVAGVIVIVSFLLGIIWSLVSRDVTKLMIVAIAGPQLAFIGIIVTVWGLK